MAVFKHRVLLGVILTCICSSIATAVYADVAVIVHPTNNSSLNEKDIAHIYMGKSSNFVNGRSALPINSTKGSASRDEFNSIVIGRSEAQLTALWSKLMFTGKGTPPKDLATDQEILATVSANPDAIGYVEASLVTDAVKVVKVFKMEASK